MANRLEMKNMTKKYGNFLANENISIALEKGEVHAIVGENGAGKTTLMRMLYGMERPTSGEIFIDGRKVAFHGPNDAIRHGIGMVHQHFMLFPDFSVAENIVIGQEPKKRGLFDRSAAQKEVEQLADRFQISVRPNVRVADCSVGEQQRMEILKVLYQGADIIILDEPTAVLTPLEVKGLLQTIRHLADQGKSVILITHKLTEVMDAADRITVLRSGKVTGSLAAGETSVSELAQLMVGRELQQLSSRNASHGSTLLEASGLTLQIKDEKPLLNNVSLTVQQGEIVGIAGVSGNGQSELLQVLTGLRKVDKGSVQFNGKDITNESVAHIRAAGLSHIPEDRYLWGAAKEATIEETAMMGYYRKPEFNKHSLLLKKPFRKLAEKWVERFEIKTNSLQERVENLSGGNLQKLIVARELDQHTPLLIAAEPTRGVDIGAMEYIHEALIEKRNQGDAVLLVSSELTEIMALSDRILVMYEGRIVGELDRTEATEERLSVLMAGGKQNDLTHKTATTA